jgi:tetratricopeptide (TPR) repeat protein
MSVWREKSEGVPSDRLNHSHLQRLSLAEILLRPFIDLEPCDRGPLCAQGIEGYWAAFADTRQPRFALQRTLPRQFRGQVLAEAGLQQLDFDDPRQVKLEARSRRWNAICDALSNWSELPIEQKCRLALLLHALCFYNLISNLISQIPGNQIASDPDYAELAYRRASARYLLDLPGRMSDYGHADLSELEKVATLAPRNQPVAFNSALKILVHRAKTGAPLEQLFKWRKAVEVILEETMENDDDFNRKLRLSRFYRAVAFIPQRQGDKAEVVRLMDLAERHALEIAPAHNAQSLLQRENLYPVIESRTKEALWLGDLDLALLRAQRLIDLDPYDSRAWLELGQVRLERNEFSQAAEAYGAAATLGPPSSAVGRHMAGHCFLHMGQPLLAAFFFKAAIDVTTGAIAPHDEIQRLPDLPVLGPIKEWSLSSFDA